jgi:hypothetical protein
LFQLDWAHIACWHSQTSFAVVICLAVWANVNLHFCLVSFCTVLYTS